MVVGRRLPLTLVKPAAWLLVWALTLVAIDGAVIFSRGDGHSSTSPAARGTTTSTTAIVGSSSDAGSETSLPGSTATTGDATTTTLGSSESPTSVSQTTAVTNPTGATTSTTPEGEVVVAHEQGDGDTNAEAHFHVDGHWQLRWQVGAGKGVAATVGNDDDPNAPPFFVPMRPPEGTSDFTTGCNCSLHLVPDGSSYDVLVVDVSG